jgi:hypothetical protein
MKPIVVPGCLLDLLLMSANQKSLPGHYPRRLAGMQTAAYPIAVSVVPDPSDLF